MDWSDRFMKEVCRGFSARTREVKSSTSFVLLIVVLFIEESSFGFLRQLVTCYRQIYSLNLDSSRRLRLYQRGQVPYVLQPSYLRGRKLDSKCSLNRQQQPHMLEAIPPVYIVGRQLWRENDLIIVEHIMKHIAQF
jgi:hypothetical protein